MQNNFGNYDTPQQPLPVYRKPCGCIMKLVKLNDAADDGKCLLFFLFSCHEYFVQPVVNNLDPGPP